MIAVITPLKGKDPEMISQDLLDRIAVLLKCDYFILPFELT
jgi:hypothetical protein